MKLISDRYIDDIINDGQEPTPAPGTNPDIKQLSDALALKIDNKLDSALKQIDEILSKIKPEEPKEKEPEKKEDKKEEAEKKEGEKEDE